MPDLVRDLDHREPRNAAPLVIYHSPCLDGFTAAWACWLACPDAEFVPGVHGQAPPDCAGRDVYLLDFSYKRAVLKSMARAAKSVTILDHHKTAEAELANLWDADGPDTYMNTVAIFDMGKSGARLAWEWFHPGAKVPSLVLSVEDRDLWRFALPDSAAVNAALFSHDYDFHTWSRLRHDLESPDIRAKLVVAGETIERKQAKDIKELVKNLRRDVQFTKCWDLHKQWIPCANLPYTLASDAASLMAGHAPFAATYFQAADGSLNFSLRSRGEDGADVSVVAQRYGGGGHRNAAGFRVASLEEL
jgi:oligoribonuclease NrnB/cAMP/cGMP phosphodiesterase (DHH superfamily)